MAKKAEVIITCDASTVKQVLAGLNREMDKTKQRRQELQRMQEQGTKLTKTEQRELQQLIKYENALNEKTQKSEKDMMKFGEVMKDLSGSKLKDLKRALQEGKNALNKMSERDPGREKLVHDLKRIQEQIEKNTGAIKKQESAWGSLGTTLKNLVAYAFVFAGFNKLKGLFGEVIELNKQFSDQMANVRKVSGLAMKDIAQLAGQLSKIDSRTSLSGLMELAYTGSKLGFGNYGIEGLEAFARSAVKVQNALSEDMGEESMTALSKLVEVMGLIPKMGVERAMDAAGSAIFKLASTSTATGTNIIEFTKRLMGLANVSHVTTAELLALGSASDSMGLMAEVSATAFNKVFTSIQSNYKEIEKSVGLTEGTIKGLLNQGKTMEAIVTVFEQMHGMSMEEMQTRGVFKALGSDGARLNNVMTTMANKIDMLREHLQTSNEAFGEATAVAKEYEIQMDTAAAYSERARNIWTKAYVNPEGVDVTKELAKAWYDVSKSLTESERFMFTTKAMLYGIIEAIKILIRLLPDIGLAGMVGMVAALIVKLRTTESLLVSLTAWYGKLNAAQKTFMKASLWSAAALAIWEIGSAIYEEAQRAKQATEYMKGFNKTLSDVNKEQYTAVRQLDRYVTAINSATNGTKERAAAIANFNKIYKPYLSEMLTEKSTALDVAKAYQEVVRQMEAKIALQAKEKDIEKFITPRVSWEADRLEAYDNSVSGTGRSQYNGTWLKGFVDDARAAGKSIADVAKELNDRVFHLSDEDLNRVYNRRGYNSLQAEDKRNQGMLESARTQAAKMAPIDRQAANSLLMALNYALQSYSTSNAMNRINRKYKPFEKSMNSLNLGEDSILQYNNEAPDKDALKQARKEEAERRKQLRSEMKEEQQQAKAIIDNVRNYYQRQINAVTEMATETGMSSELQKQTVAGLQQRMNDALANVRKAIGGTKNDWDAFKQTMREDLYEPLNESGTNLSTELLDKIVDNDIAKLRTMIERLSKELNQQGSVLLDQILSKASVNEGQNAKIDNTFARLREKELLAKNYTGKVELDYENVMEQFGIAGINDAQSRQIRDWSKGNQDEDIKAFFEERTALWRTAFNNARENLVQLLQTDVSSKEGQEGALKLLFGEDYDTALAGSSLQGVLDMSADQWQVFYMKLIEMTDAWTDAQKKAYDEVKSREDYIFKNRPDIIALDANVQSLDRADTELNRFGSPATFGRQMGIVDTIENDPEIMRLQLLQQRAEMYYDRMKELREQDKISEEQLKQAKDSLYEAQMATQAKMAEAIKERTETIKNAIQPVTEFAEDAGQKLGDMILNMQSQSMTWNQIWKKMVLALAKSTIQMGAQWLTQKIQKSLLDKQMEADEVAHQAQLTNIAIQGGLARVQGQAAIDAMGLSANAASNAAELGQDAASTSAEVPLGIAKGAAKTIGKLGWWGIPLVAVISSLLMGLLSSALSSAGAETAAATKEPDTKASEPKINSKLRLGKGMLTYNEGNVKRFVGDDGRVYTAREDMDPGTGLVAHPIATMVQGQPALVAEKGPEIVVGRETTRNIMMNEPELIRYLAEYDKHHGRYLPTFDAGNVAGATEATPAPFNNDNNSISQTLIALNQTLAMLQQQIATGIRANINMYGTDGLYEQHKKAEAFMKRYS